MNVADLLTNACAGQDDRAALIAGFGPARRETSFGELRSRVSAVAAQFTRQGLCPGDRVLLAVPLSVETYIVMLALLKAGQVVMFIDPAHSAKRVARILRNWPPDAVVATRAILMMRFLLPELGRAPLRFSVDGRSRGATRLKFAGGDATAPTCHRKSMDSALLTFTSGSTGEPKAVVRTHGFLRRQLDMLDRVADLGASEIDFVAMPMFVLFNLARGVTSVLPACDMKQPAKADPATVSAQLEKEGATRIVASPALLERLADYCSAREKRLPGVRRYSTGGGPVSPSLAARLEAVSPGAIVRMVYGSTEAEPIACIDSVTVSPTDRQRMQRGGGLLAGRPVEGCYVRIVRTRPGLPLKVSNERQFAALCMEPGTIGEIVVSGKHVLSGYADASQDRETKIKLPGVTWHRTGDAGYFDATGRLWLVGRSSAVIHDRHGSVYPFQVEYAANAIPGIARSALVTRDGIRTLVIENRGRGIACRCDVFAGCISAHRIDRILAVPRIPLDRRHNAKIDYPALHRLLDGRMERIRLYAAERISSVFRAARRGACSAFHAMVRHVSWSRNLGAADPAPANRNPLHGR
jgi:acyl-CoA synthetase (AMP-forming)/AMP-acid ligase II